MRLGAITLALFSLQCPLSAEQTLTAILSRVSEEAEVFRMLAPKTVGREKLNQRAMKQASRFKLRVGADAYKKAPDIKFQNREIVSEYGYSTLQDAPDALLELRQIVSIDGRPVADGRKARSSLTLGLQNNDERAKKRMLKRFAKHGLRGAATDFGQMLLLFRRRNLENYDFSIVRNDRLGADEVVVLRYEQRMGPASFTVFRGRAATHAKLEGEIWVRQKDSLPLRITLSTVMEDGELIVVHHGTIDYSPSAYGTLLPASVRYRQTVQGKVVVEISATYSDYHMFAVESEIKFTPAEEPLETPAGKPEEAPRSEPSKPPTNKASGPSGKPPRQ